MTEREIAEKLNRLSIFDLRQLARKLGVIKPSEGKKERLLGEIMKIARGEYEECEKVGKDGKPVARRGAPPKSNSYNEELYAQIMAFQRGITVAAFLGNEENNSAEVNDPSLPGAVRVRGVIGLYKGEYFLYERGVETTQDSKIYIHDNIMTGAGLSAGDEIWAQCAPVANEGLAVCKVYAVNGGAEVAPVKPFENFRRIYPETRIYTAANDNATLKMLDLFAPLAFGQRAFISCPDGGSAERLLNGIASGICRNHPQSKVILLLLNIRPEDGAEAARVLPGAEVYYTTFATPREESFNLAETVLERAKRISEAGGDAVILADGLTALCKKYGVIDGEALEKIKKMLACAGNLEEGGSVTLLSTLIYGNSPVDAAVCAELSGIENAKIAYNGELDILNCRSESGLAGGTEQKLAEALRNKISSGAAYGEIYSLFVGSGSYGEIAKKVGL